MIPRPTRIRPTLTRTTMRTSRTGPCQASEGGGVVSAATSSGSCLGRGPAPSLSPSQAATVTATPLIGTAAPRPCLSNCRIRCATSFSDDYDHVS